MRRALLAQVLVVPAITGLIPANPHLLLLVVDVPDDGLGLGGGERLRDRNHGVEREMHLPAAIPIRERVKTNWLGVDTGPIENALKLSLVHAGTRLGGVCARLTRRREDDARRLAERAVVNSARVLAELSRALFVAKQCSALSPRDDDLPSRDVLLEAWVGPLLEADLDLAVAAHDVEELHPQQWLGRAALRAIRVCPPDPERARFHPPTVPLRGGTSRYSAGSRR